MFDIKKKLCSKLNDFHWLSELSIFVVITLKFLELKSNFFFYIFWMNLVFICVYLWYICNMHIIYHLPFKYNYNNPSVILGCVCSTVIFKVELPIATKSNHKLVDSYEISISQIAMECFPSTWIFFFPLSPRRILPDLSILVTV